MKKNKLIVEYEYEFTLFGVVSLVSEHKLAWEINNTLKISLIKSEDIQLNFIHNKNLIISNYVYEKEDSNLRLLKNKSYKTGQAQLYILPELKQFDYLLAMSGFEQTFSKERIINSLNKISIIQYIVNIEVEKLKSKENLVF